MNWASILEDEHQGAGRAHRVAAVHPSRRGPHARRPPRQGRDGRLGHPDPRRHHSGRGRGRHRLRDDRGPHPVHRDGRPAPRAAWRRCARRSRRAIPLSAGQVQRRRATTPAPSAASRDLEERDGAGQRRGDRAELAAPARAASARATTSSRSAWTRQDRVWLFLHSGSRGVGNKLAASTSRSRRSCASAGGSACPTRTSPTWWRGPRSSGPTSATCAGRSTSRC